MNPIVSVCIPCWNSEHTIGRALESVLAQTYGDFEVIVSDNASTDGTADIVRSFRDARIRLHRNPANVDCYPNSNISWRLSTGDLITFLHSDDTYEPHRLSLLTQMLRDAPEVVFAYNAVTLVDEKGNVREMLRGHPASTILEGIEELRYQMGFRTGEVGIMNPPLVHRSAMEKVGGYDVRFPLSADRHLHWKLCTMGKVAYCAESLYRWSVHPYVFDHEPFTVPYGNYHALRGFLEDYGRDPEIERVTRRALQNHKSLTALIWASHALATKRKDPLRLVSPLSLLAMAIALSPGTILGAPFSPRIWRKWRKKRVEGKV